MTGNFSPADGAIQYTLRRSRRARYMRLTIRPDGTLLATRPWWVSQSAIERFIFEKRVWIEQTIARIRSQRAAVSDVSQPSTKHFLQYRRQALSFIVHRVNHFVPLLGVSHRRITVRNQRSRWGSCSRKGNLSFNYRLMFLPPFLADYVIVHELCHLVEFNHSARFWGEVGRILPDYQKARSYLKQFSLE